MNTETVLDAIKDDQSIDGVNRNFIVGTPKLYSCPEHGVQLISVVHDPQVEGDKYCTECYSRLVGEDIE